jgi:2-amino-4-hydroxy-6-hydroxymethyldihydropteridine diphosphokinase
MTSLVFIGLGSNLGHPRRRIARAIAALARLPRSRLLAVSGNYASAPLGVSQPQPDYVNAVALVRTALPPAALLGRMRAIERRLGRRRTDNEPRNAPRTLDLDLLLYGRRRMSQPRLVVPHPRMHARAFVLRPLLDIAPAASIPGRGSAKSASRATRGQRIARTRRHFWR